MRTPAGTLPGTDTVFTGGSIDAMCDQIVAGADQPGDVHVIFGATLIVWVVTDEWLQVPGLISYPHTTPDRFVIGGPSNAGALFVDWARTLLRGAPRPGPAREKLDARLGSPERVPIWLPYVRGERTPFDDHTLRSNLYGLDIGSGPEALERAAFEASGFVIRRIIDAAGRRRPADRRQRRRLAGHGLDGRRGRRHQPAGRRRGRARRCRPRCGLLARMAAGLGDLAQRLARWASVGRRIEPDPAGSGGTESRVPSASASWGPAPSGRWPVRLSLSRWA